MVVVVVVVVVIVVVVVVVAVAVVVVVNPILEKPNLSCTRVTHPGAGYFLVFIFDTKMANEPSFEPHCSPQSGL